MGDQSSSGETVDVQIDSLATLRDALENDQKTLGDNVSTWSDQSRETNPVNAQIGENALFVEGVTLRANNTVSYAETQQLLTRILLGQNALTSGAALLAEVYQGTDGFNNVRLAAISDMFLDADEVTFKTGEEATTSEDTTGTVKPLTDDSGAYGYDMDGDGKVDVAVSESTAGETTVESTDPLVAVDPTTHDDYAEPFDTINVVETNSDDDNQLSQAGKDYIDQRTEAVELAREQGWILPSSEL